MATDRKTPTQPTTTAKRREAQAERKTRLARELRANLKKRRRQRAERADESGPAEDR